MTNSPIALENLAVLQEHGHWPSDTRTFDAEHDLTQDEQGWCEDNYAQLPDSWEEAKTMLGHAPQKLVGTRQKQTSARNSGQYKRHGDAIELARAAAKAAGWPAITGTTKQKYWALQLREKMVATLPADLRAWAVQHITQAAWWITNRDEAPAKLVALVKDAQTQHEERVRSAEILRQIAQRAIDADNAAFDAATKAKEIAYANALDRYLPQVMASLDQAIPLPAGTSPVANAVKMADGIVEQVGRVRVFQQSDSKLIVLLGQSASSKIIVGLVELGCDA